MELVADEHQSDWYSARLRARAGESPSLRGPEVDSGRRDWAKPVKAPEDRDKGLIARLRRDDNRRNRHW
jgi:hypothetical protein